MKATLTIAAFVAAAAILVPSAPEAKEFRYALKGPVLTMDPHSSADFLSQSVMANIFDPLVRRNRDLELVPGLATSWELVNPTTWRFKLRPNVTFHDGSPFTAEDVAFSIGRAQPSGMFSQYVGGVVGIKIVDPLTIDITTRAPDPLLPRWFSVPLMMDKEWSIANDSEAAAKLAAGEEQFAVRNANGTGMFKLKEFESQVRTMMTRNDAYWDKTESNITEATYTPIASTPTRVAALLSGEVDLVGDLPIADVERVKSNADFKVSQKPELRMVQLEMSPFRPEGHEVWDKNGAVLAENPWRDLRVRQAVAHAIHTKQIVDRVMRGFAYTTAVPSIRGINGYQEDLDTPFAFDPDRSRALLAEAGYPDGFSARLLCPNNRYVNDEAICRAIGSMLARVGIEAQIEAVPWSNYVQDLINFRSDFHLVGAAPNGQDTFDMLQGTWMTREGDQAGNGFYNWSRWSNKEFDTAVESLKTEFDPGKRNDLYREALSIARDNVAAVFLHSQVIVWGMKENIDATIRQDAYVMLRWISVN